MSDIKKEEKKVGLVPTMGALHQGHLSLVEIAQQHAELVVVSIFVNPTQFNNPEDLEKYPRKIEEDLALLRKHKNVVVFSPEVEEMYPSNHQAPSLDLGDMGKVMEGKFRPGHFDGVVEVVKRLFDIVHPDCACFGEKDFQQLSVIQLMTTHFQMNINIIGCPIIREKTGLAMSSRNLRLSEKEHEEALAIYATLQLIKKHTDKHPPKVLQERAIQHLANSPLKVEYLKIVDPVTLQALEGKWVEGARCCIAAFCGEVRLIDNMEIN